MSSELLEMAEVWLTAHNMFFVIVMLVICFHRPRWIPKNRVYRVREILTLYVIVASLLLIGVSAMLMYSKGLQ